LGKEIILAGHLGPYKEDLINCEVTHLTTRRHIPEDVDQHQHRSECLRHGTIEISFRTPYKTHETLNSFSLFSVRSDFTVATDRHKIIPPHLIFDVGVLLVRGSVEILKLQKTRIQTSETLTSGILCALNKTVRSKLLQDIPDVRVMLQKKPSNIEGSFRTNKNMY